MGTNCTAPRHGVDPRLRRAPPAAPQASPSARWPALRRSARCELPVRELGRSTPPGSLLAIERGSVSPTLRSPPGESWQLHSRQRGSSPRARGGRSRGPPELAHPPTHRFAQPLEIVSLVGNLDVLFEVKRHVGDVVPREVLHGGGEDAVALGVFYG